MTGESSNVAELVTSAARARPDKVALIDTGTGAVYSWWAVEAAVTASARRLREAGIERGDRVALRLPTSVAFAVSFFAVVRVGAVAVPLNPYEPAEASRPLLRHSGARLLIADEPLDPAVSAGSNPVVTLQPVLQPEPVRSDAAEPPEPSEPLPARCGGEDIAALLYTSGTTGPSRGVLLSHRALLANVAQLRSLTPSPVEPTDRVYLAVPLHHVFGLGPGLLAVAAAGATAVLAPRFEVRSALSDCLTHRVTVVLGVPAMYAEMAARPADEVGECLSTARLLASGAAPLRPKVLSRIREVTGLAVYEGYGLTEAAPVVTSTLVTGYAKPGSVGKPLPGVEVRLVDGDDASEPGTAGAAGTTEAADPDDPFDDTDGTGLVAVRGDNLFSGYWPDGAGGPDAEGWLRTGDVGYLDVDGDLHLVDRAGDLVIVNGFNVYPREVEEVLAALPQVAEAAVVGVLDERSGEAVKAVVVPAPGAALSEQQVIEHCEARLARYKVPTVVEFNERLPQSAMGKVRRAGLRGVDGVDEDGGHA